MCLHAFDVVGEDLERDRAVGNSAKQLAAKGFVVEDAGLAHQGGVGGESLDPGIGVKCDDAFEVGAVAEEFDSEVLNFRQGLLLNDS